MMRLAILFCVVAAGCGGASLCDGVSGHCVAFGKSATEAQIQTSFAAATAGTTFVFAAGDFKFSNELTITTDNITIKGAGSTNLDTTGLQPTNTILDFSTQTAGAEGLLAMNNGFTIEDLEVADPKGDGIKVVGATGVTYHNVFVTWTSTDLSTHGPYAIYPVQCSNVLVENCTVSGASDAGFYIGQSNQIVVRNNTAEQNVAGIEIENSHFAEVYGNMAHDNTAGILVFALPGLQQFDTHDVSVHDNTVASNNTANFAVVGDIVGIVPAGTGSFVMASDNVEFFNNSYSDNNTANFAIISYLDSGLMYTDQNYYPYATRVNVHDNTFSGGGTMPDTTMAQPSIGGLLAESKAMFPGGKDADIMYDGITDDMHMSTIGAANNMDICIGTNGGASFLNLHFDEIDGLKGLTQADPSLVPYTCTLAPVAKVSFPGLTQ